MHTILFLGTIALFLGTFLAWGFRHLPDERWQMLAIVPRNKTESQLWRGLNLTYYGFFIATSQLLSITLLLVLLGAVHISLPGTLLATLMLLAVCLPAARLVARLVEKKHHTFTIGGASFVGILLAPACIEASRHILSVFGECSLPLIPVLAAMAIAYTLGEGLGRLACMSYGCCYGKPLSSCGPFLRAIFAKTGTVFSGPIKKAAYEGQLNGARLVPVQAITCVLYTLTSLVGSWLFLQSQFVAGFVLCMTVTQVWRLISETLRADFRGFGKVSGYQKMGLIALLYSLAVAAFCTGGDTLHPVIVEGLSNLWDPAVLLGLQGLWLLFFLYFGRSTVTSSTVSFGLIDDRI